MFKITFRTGCNIVLANTQARSKGSMLALCVADSPFMYCLGREIFFLFGTTKPVQSIWTYFVITIFYDCIIFNIVI